MDTSFIDSDDGKTVTINKKGSDTQVQAPRAKFENPENYGDVEKQNFNLAFKEQANIEARLKNLQEFNRKIAENRIKRIKNPKVIFNRTFVNYNGSLFFKEKGEKEYLEPKLIIKGDRYYSKGKKNSSAINQFKDSVKQLPDITSELETTLKKTMTTTH